MKKPHEQSIELQRLPKVNSHQERQHNNNNKLSELETSGGIENGARQANCQTKPIRPLALKLNNFLLWAGAGCAHPYFSVYFLHYTGASEKEFGRLMSSAAVIGTILNLTLSSLSDRYRAHRLIYLLSLAGTYLAIGLLLVPIVSMGHKGPSEPERRVSNVSLPADCRQSADEHLSISAISTVTLVDENNVLNDLIEGNVAQQVAQVEIQQESFVPLYWVYIIQVCLAIGSLGIAINMNFSESFSANLGHCNSETGGEESYCSIRFFGALGWCLASLVLSQVDEQSLGLPYLFVPWLLFTCLYGLATFLVLVWPDKRPFSLASEIGLPPPQLGSQLAKNMEIGLASDKVANISFGRPLGAFRWRNKLEQSPKEPVFIGLRRVSWDLSIESANHRVQPRRSSMAALGNSHLIEQYQLNGDANLRRWSNKHNVNGMAFDDEMIDESHFKYVTTIKPASGANYNEPSNLSNKTVETTKSMSFKLYLKIIELIGRRNKNMPRFLVLYAVVGFVVAMNWYFLFPYLNELNPAKFRQLGPYVMMSGYLSEMLFYYASPRVPFKVPPSVGLSCVLLVFAIRYTIYLTFCHWPNAAFWPMEMIIVVELLQSLTIGWFDCILNESAMEFALEAEHCLPKLIELKLIDDAQSELVEMVKSSVKLSLVGVSACFYDGIGVALGSLAGGWLIVRYDYSVLWQLSAAISLTVALANLLLEWTLFKGYKSGDQRESIE